MDAAIDWGTPWFSPWREPGERVAALAQGRPVHEALNRAGAASPVRFVPQAHLAPGEAYEAHVFRTGDCPTRDNLHDFFNGLCWMTFPRAKRKLNHIQAAEIARLGVGARRGPVRDAITIFDENGALLHAPAPLWQALVARDWRALFVEQRALWGEARLVVFGHALLEKLACPRKDLTAHVWCEPMPAGPLSAMDEVLAERITADRLAAKPFTPLPVLGIPGWTPQNENFSFYDDSFIFRPAGPKSQAQRACLNGSSS